MTAKAYLLKIRGGVEVDSKGQKAGKGPLIAEEISNTLGTSQDQYLFQPVGVDCYNLALTGDKGRCLATASGGLNEHIPVVLQPAAYGVVTKGNGDAFISKEKHTSLSTGGGQAGQGYPCVLLDDQGGSVMRVSDGDVSPTLRAKMNGHPPIIFKPMGFDCYNQSVTGDVTTTLRAGMSNCSADTVPVVLENHPSDSRVRIDESGIVQTLTSRMGTGGGNVPMVMIPYSKSRRAKSSIDFETWREAQVSNTINTFDQGDVRATDVVVMATQRPNAEVMVDKCPTITASAGLGGTWKPVVAYGISSYESNAMKSSNPHAGIYETNTARTIDVNGGNPACNQGGVVVVEQMYWDGSQIAGTLTTSNASGAQRMPDKEQFNYNKPGTQEAMNDMFVVCEKTVPKSVSMEVFHCDSVEERTAALKARDYKDPQIIAFDRAALPGRPQPAIAVDCRNLNTTPEMSGTIQAKENGGQSLNFINPIMEGKMKNEYIVRRLTPLECCRLQGFPDGWGEIDPKDDFTDEEYAFWLDVRSTWSRINGREEKEYTKEQMLTWYNKLHTDSAEYKMWGNGISLPTAYFVLSRMKEQFEESESENVDLQDR